MSRESLEQRVRTIAESAASENEAELVHTEIVGGAKNRTVRIFIDKPGGITHDDCAAVSRKVSELLDRGDPIQSEYILEVSSPGLERGLYSLEDFVRFSGHSVRIKTLKAINGQKHYSGRVIGVLGEEIDFDDKSSGTLRIPYSAIAKANLEIDIEEEFKRTAK